MTDDLERARDIDFAKIDLDYEGFRKLARNPNLSPHERIGFPNSYRETFDAAIFEDICRKLPALNGTNKTIVDIGPGCASLPRMMIAHCAQKNNRLILVDSDEMLSQLPDGDHVTKIGGFFPNNADIVRTAISGQADAVLCYSVLHYLFVETNPFHVLDVIIGLLQNEAAALIGDIPNASKRSRFFAGPSGIQYHKHFTGRDELPPVQPPGPLQGKIDDAVLAGLVARAQAAGCDAYVLPQPSDLPMANRRDDLLLRKP